LVTALNLIILTEFNKKKNHTFIKVRKMLL